MKKGRFAGRVAVATGAASGHRPGDASYINNGVSLDVNGGLYMA